MIQDVKVRPFKDKNGKILGYNVWYSYIEICDECGKVMQTHSCHTTESPNPNKKSLCIECLRKKYDI